jgi:RNA polymerase sigma-70 factor (ECF subfamily)
VARPAPETPFGDDLAGARRGDRDALARVLAVVHDHLLHAADRSLGVRLRSKTRASDVVQDAYAEVVQRIAEFAGNDQDTFLAWVRAIVHNAARQQHRRLGAQRRRSPSGSSELAAFAHAILRGSRSPATELEQAETVTLVMRAIESLREDHRVVIEQVVLRRRPVGEVARDLGRSEVATRMLLSRARAALTLAVDRLG